MTIYANRKHLAGGRHGGALRVYSPIVIFGFVMLFIHIIISTPNNGDESHFLKAIEYYNYNLIDYSVMRYNQWTSRTFIEVVLVYMVSIPVIVWRIIDTVIMIVGGVFLSKIFFPQEHRFEGNIISACLLLLFPFLYMSSAGWIATTINYIWPVVFGLVAIYPLRKIADRKKIHTYEYILYIISLLFAANQEQMCFVLLTVYCVFTIYMLVKKQVNTFVLIQAGLCLLSLIYILLSPGNALRYESEVSNWFPDYGAFSLVQKAELGISVSLSTLFFKNNWLFFVLAFIVCFLVWTKHRKALYRVVAAIPLLVSITFFSLNAYRSSENYFAQKLLNIVSRYGIVNAETVSSLKTFIVLAGLLFSVCALILSLYILLGNNMSALIAIGVLVMGIATRAVIGFSPTVWASVDRTAAFLLFSLIACVAYLMGGWEFWNKRIATLVLLLFMTVGVFGGINNIMSIIF